MGEEIGTCEETETWSLVPLPQDVKLIGACGFTKSNLMLMERY